MMKKKYDEISQYISEKDFLLPLHSLVFRAITKCVSENTSFNQDRIYNLIKSDRDFVEEEFLTILSKSPLAEVQVYAKSLRDERTKRVLRNLCAQSLKQIDDNEEYKNIIETLEQGLCSITLTSTKIEDFSIQIDESINRFLKAKEHEGELRGLDTGFSKLNSITTGFNAGELIVIGARPSMGKTALILNIIQKMIKNGDGVVFFSLEMPAYQLINRLISSTASIELHKIRSGSMTKKEEQTMFDTANQLKTLPLVIDDNSYISIFELRSKIRYIKRKKPEIKCVVIDYLQLMSGSKKTSDKRHEEIAEISRGLKNLVRELDIVVIALSQLNRAVESREDKRPNLGDLRESGSIEQDADVIIFLYRDDVYTQKEQLAKQKKMQKEGKIDLSLSNLEEKTIENAELIVAKNRNGATKTIFVQFNKPFTRFEEPTKPSEQKNLMIWYLTSLLSNDTIYKIAMI